MRCIYCNKNEMEGLSIFCNRCEYLPIKNFLIGVNATIAKRLKVTFENLPENILDELCTLAHKRFKVFQDYGILREWNTDRIYGEYLEAYELQLKWGTPIEIPLKDDFSIYSKMNFLQYQSPKETAFSNKERT
jgi:hypothetical protein